MPLPPVSVPGPSPRSAALEVLHLAAGLLATAAIFAGAEWAYPIGAGTLRWVGWLTMAAVLVMGLVPLRDAWRGDRRGPGRRGRERPGEPVKGVR